MSPQEQTNPSLILIWRLANAALPPSGQGELIRDNLCRGL